MLYCTYIVRIFTSKQLDRPTRRRPRDSTLAADRSTFCSPMTSRRNSVRLVALSVSARTQNRENESPQALSIFSFSSIS